MLTDNELEALASELTADVIYTHDCQPALREHIKAKCLAALRRAAGQWVKRDDAFPKPGTKVLLEAEYIDCGEFICYGQIIEFPLRYMPAPPAGEVK